MKKVNGDSDNLSILSHKILTLTRKPCSCPDKTVCCSVESRYTAVVITIFLKS